MLYCRRALWFGTFYAGYLRSGAVPSARDDDALCIHDAATPAWRARDLCGGS